MPIISYYYKVEFRIPSEITAYLLFIFMMCLQAFITYSI